MKLKALIFLTFFFHLFGIKAQRLVVDTSTMMQLSGVIVSDVDLEPIPYVTVYDKSIRRGVIADFYGFFSLVTFPGDTLFFSSPGHNTSSFIVPDTLEENRYSIIHMLTKNLQNLPEITVYPWPSKDQFAQYFLNMKPYDDAMRRAQRELSGESLAFVSARIDTDASLAYGYSQNQRNTKLYTNGQLPVNNLLNPYSWAKLISDWKEGKLSRQ
ncbi:MAG: hypothetical protein NT109_10390 [Flavobacteriia bacterium]|nr:hypothetical protein [Flavobacteriia bacterium]